MRVLWITNDLPPRAGGIEQFVGNLLDRVHPGGTVVLGPSHPGAGAHDGGVAYRVVRAPGAVLPTPRTLGLARRLARAHQPDVIVLGAAWPLGELAQWLGRTVGVPVVALTHGLEAGLAMAGAGVAIRRATRHLAAVTTLSRFTARLLAPHLECPLAARLHPGVDGAVFHPGRGGARARLGVPADAPLVGCVSRLVPRKGQDTLLDAWPHVLARRPDAWLVLAGDGPSADGLRQRASGLPQVAFAGALDWDVLPDAHADLDVFAMPCRTRWGGLDVEGLGIVYLEAQSCGVPVVAGRSGGAPEAVLDGVSGHVVDGADPLAVADAVSRLLADPDLRRRMGEAGLAWVRETWTWDAAAARLVGLLRTVVGGAPA